jgi:hypothetical protein
LEVSGNGDLLLHHLQSYLDRIAVLSPKVGFSVFDILLKKPRIRSTILLIVKDY